MISGEVFTLSTANIKRETEAETGSELFNLLAHAEGKISSTFSRGLTVFFQDNVQCYVLSLIREIICCLIPEWGCSDLAVTGVEAAVSLVATAKFDRDHESEP